MKKSHTLILDAGPLIKVGVRIKDFAENFVTIPEVLKEIRDKQSRQQLALFPFEIKTRIPDDEAYKAVVAFAKKTGDFSALSTVDLKVLALTYMLEKEHCGLDHIRTEPIKAQVNVGKVFKKPTEKKVLEIQPGEEFSLDINQETNPSENTFEQVNIDFDNENKQIQDNDTSINEEELGTSPGSLEFPTVQVSSDKVNDEIVDIGDGLTSLNVSSDKENSSAEEPLSDSSSDGGEWITPVNLNKKQLESAGHLVHNKKILEARKVACITTDYAMQSVILQMNLALLSVEGIEIKNLRSFVLRCHACFKVTSDLSKQFCPSCGGPTLIRTSCSVDGKGNVKYYLKKNFRYNLRGIKYNIPTPKGGHKNNDLILCEDQKEYQRARKNFDHYKESNLFDPDYLPGILTGKHSSKAHAPTIGFGKKNPNQAKRRSGRKKS